MIHECKCLHEFSVMKSQNFLFYLEKMLHWVFLLSCFVNNFYLIATVHIDWCYHSIHKHLSRSQYVPIWWHRGFFVYRQTWGGILNTKKKKEQEERSQVYVLSGHEATTSKQITLQQTLSIGKKWNSKHPEQVKGDFWRIGFVTA